MERRLKGSEGFWKSPIWRKRDSRAKKKNDLEGQKKHLEGQTRYMEGQNKRLEGQKKHLEGQTRYLEGQNKHLGGERKRLEQQTRSTTLMEYLEFCHEKVFSQFKVQQNPALSSRGGTTNPKGKLCPDKLVQWDDFLTQQVAHLQEVFSCSPLHERLFDSKHWLSVLGKKFSASPIADEEMLERYVHYAVENPVHCIVEELAKKNLLGAQYGIARGVIFLNHPSAISDVALEVDSRVAAPPQTPQPSQYSHKLRPDQICVYRGINENATSEERKLLLVEEYKAPHKLSAQHIRVGLEKNMDIFREVVNNPKIPTPEDPRKYFSYCGKRGTAAALVQTYDYMIHAGAHLQPRDQWRGDSIPQDRQEKVPGRVLL
ncbi:uncharacterized protein MAM_00366 [Metarhizium album ARSEF 1941]|uniref:Uncharacterized protein n=1 Tax=Metarhizium album (strain ARSEF 1941) TaxID=1081103 RepID=A0A0B2X7A2_METAS|nr:uncharacterized protein MAM_00366 [Metarhizium album ARSEF 1941]KHO01365.1 hypothetical protein MAM_00366 [Metarhizium album ARSEF 1941]